jgi:hypothetical protein
MRGRRTPLVVLFTSRIAEDIGAVVPMPTEPEEGKVFWAWEKESRKTSAAIRDNDFMIDGGLEFKAKKVETVYKIESCHCVPDFSIFCNSIANWRTLPWTTYCHWNVVALRLTHFYVLVEFTIRKRLCI